MVQLHIRDFSNAHESLPATKEIHEHTLIDKSMHDSVQQHAHFRLGKVLQDRQSRVYERALKSQYHTILLRIESQYLELSSAHHHVPLMQRETCPSLDFASRLKFPFRVFEREVRVVHRPDDTCHTALNVDEERRVPESLYRPL